jgi:hypothetical protein
MGGQESHCQKPSEREAEKPGAKDREAVDYKPAEMNGHGIESWEPARPDEVESLIASTAFKINELVDDMRGNIAATIKVEESMKKDEKGDKGKKRLFSVESIDSILSANLPTWDLLFKLEKEQKELEQIFSLAQTTVDAYFPLFEKVLMGSPTKRWEGLDLVGFKGQVKTINLVSVSFLPLHVNLIVAAILLKIQEKHKQEKSGENIFFCIRISPGQEDTKLEALKSLYSCVSGSTQGLKLNEHLPIMLHQVNGVVRYFEASKEISKLGQ